MSFVISLEAIRYRYTDSFINEWGNDKAVRVFVLLIKHNI